jgi:hypothetical protein
MIELITNFECGNGKAIEQLGDAHFRLEVEADKQTGYGSYFCFDLANDGAAVEVTIDVYEDSKFGEPTTFGRVFPTTIWIKPVDFHRYRPLRGQLPECEDGHIRFRVPVEEKQRLRVAETYVAPFTEVAECLEGFALERADRCVRFSLGQSVEGRELVGLRAGTAGKPKVVCVAGQHPHEHGGVWASLGIADFVSSRMPQAERIRNEAEIYVIPIVNPDGNVAGHSAFNAEGLDMYLAFGDEPDAPEPEAHESKLIWAWIRSEMPALWVNFHAFTGWQLNSEYPYHGWYEVEDRNLFSNIAQKRLYDAVCDTLRLTTDAASTHERANVHRANTLCYQMAKRFGIPHAFYELNNGNSGRHAGSRTGIDVFGKVMTTLLTHG